MKNLSKKSMTQGYRQALRCLLAPTVLVVVVAGVSMAQTAEGFKSQETKGGQHISPSNGQKEARFDQLRKLGDESVAQGSWDRAETYYRQALDLIPMPGVQFKLAKVLEKKNLNKEALTILRQITDESGKGQLVNDPIALAEYGEVALATGNSQEAQTAFERAVEHGRSSLGAGLPQSDNYSGANGVRAAAWLAAGYQLTLTGQTEEAATAFGKGVKLQPSWDVARFYYASAIAKLGRDQEAQKTFKSLAQSANPTVRREAAKRSG